MNPEAFERTRRLIGRSACKKLSQACVLVLGLGGVGSWCVEALARAGVGQLGILDCDCVAPSNLNRQLGALTSTIGKRKTEVIRERILDINPEALVTVYDLKYEEATADSVPLASYDAVVDAIDLVSSKILLAVRCTREKIPLYSAMGGGNKLDPARFQITDLAKTDRCPLAKIMRKKLRKNGITHLKVVASDEEPRLPLTRESGRFVPSGSLPVVTGTEGLLLASAVLSDLIGPPVAPLACEEHPVLPSEEL